jgi:hypothetical protein
MTNIIPIRTVAAVLKDVEGDISNHINKTIPKLEHIRWNELTREQKIENLEALAKVLFQRLLETGRVNMEQFIDLMDEVFPDPTIYVDCIKEASE